MTAGPPTLSAADARWAPAGALWRAPGGASTGATSSVGSGVYRLAKPKSSAFSMSDRVGGSELESTFIGKVRFDGNGAVYAATSRGLWKHSASTKSGTWKIAITPVPDQLVNGVPRPASHSPKSNYCNHVTVVAEQ